MTNSSNLPNKKWLKRHHQLLVRTLHVIDGHITIRSRRVAKEIGEKSQKIAWVLLHFERIGILKRDVTKTGKISSFGTLYYIEQDKVKYYMDNTMELQECSKHE